MKSTVLWSNSSPTSAFGSQSVTLSQSIADFDYIRFNWLDCTNSDTSASMLVPVSVVQASSTNTAHRCIPTMGANFNGSAKVIRQVFYSSNTSLLFSSTNGVDGTLTANNFCIPTVIYGVKYVSSGGSSYNLSERQYKMYYQNTSYNFDEYYGSYTLGTAFTTPTIANNAMIILSVKNASSITIGNNINAIIDAFTGERAVITTYPHNWATVAGTYDVSAYDILILLPNPGGVSSVSMTVS